MSAPDGAGEPPSGAPPAAAAADGSDYKSLKERKRREQQSAVTAAAAAKQKEDDEAAAEVAQRKKVEVLRRFEEDQKVAAAAAAAAHSHADRGNDVAAPDVVAHGAVHSTTTRSDDHGEEEARIAAEESAIAERLRQEEEERAIAEQLQRQEEARVADEQAAAERLRQEEEERAIAEHLQREEEARVAAEELATAERRRQEEEERVNAEQLQREEEDRLAAEALANEERLRQEEEERAIAEHLKREEEARILAEEHAAAERLRQEEEERAIAEQLQREEEARIEAEELAAAERLRQEEEERAIAEQLQREEEARIAAEELAAAEQLRQEEEARAQEERRLAEAERLRQEEEARAAAEKLRLEADARRKEEERVAAEAKKREDEAQRKLESERRIQAEVQRRLALKYGTTPPANVAASPQAKEAVAPSPAKESTATAPPVAAPVRTDSQVKLAASAPKADVRNDTAASAAALTPSPSATSPALGATGPQAPEKEAAPVKVTAAAVAAAEKAASDARVKAEVARRLAEKGLVRTFAGIDNASGASAPPPKAPTSVAATAPTKPPPPAATENAPSRADRRTAAEAAPTAAATKITDTMPVVASATAATKPQLAAPRAVSPLVPERELTLEERIEREVAKRLAAAHGAAPTTPAGSQAPAAGKAGSSAPPARSGEARSMPSSEAPLAPVPSQRRSAQPTPEHVDHSHDDATDGTDEVDFEPDEDGGESDDDGHSTTTTSTTRERAAASSSHDAAGEDSDIEAVGAPSVTLTTLFSSKLLPPVTIDVNTAVLPSSASLTFFVVDDCPMRTYSAAVTRRATSASSAQMAAKPAGSVLPFSFVAYHTKREEGRCLRPLRHEEAFFPTMTHHAILLNFFSAQQRLLVKTQHSSPTAASRDHNSGFKTIREYAARERPSGGGKVTAGVSLLTRRLQFEQSGDPALEAADVLDASLEAVVESSYPAGHPCESAARTCDRFTRPDVVQLYFRAKGIANQGLPPPGAPGAAAVPVGGSPKGVTAAPAGAKGLYCGSDYEPTKPAPCIPMFSNGTLVRIDVNIFNTPIHVTNGADCDPLFGTIAPFVIGPGNACIKIGETFHFNNNGTAPFFPGSRTHPAHLFNSCVTFVPNELRYGRLVLLARFFRPCPDEGETWVDVYYRPNKYSHSNIHQYRQKTISNCSQMQAAAGTIVLTEIGWNSFKFFSGGRLVEGDQSVAQMFLSPKNTNDATLADYVINDVKRSKLYTAIANMTIRLTDVTKYEISTPHSGADTSPVEEETVLQIQDMERVGGPRIPVRYCPCTVPVLNAGCYSAYTSTFYVRLHSLNLTKIVSRGQTPMRTFTVRVTLKETDDNIDTEGLCCAYQSQLSQSFCEQRRWSTASLGERIIEFGDEMKFQLPLVLTERHHLVLHVFAVWLKPGQPTFTPVAVAVLPIFASQTVLQQERIKLPVALAESVRPITSGYLMRLGQLPPSAFVSGGETVLELSTSLRSTVYSTNNEMSGLFTKIPPILSDIEKTERAGTWFGGECGSLTQAYAGGATMALDAFATSAATIVMQQAPLPEIVAFFPLVVMSMLAIITSPSRSIGMSGRAAAMRALVEAATKVESLEISQQRRAAPAAAGRGAASNSPVKSSSPKEGARGGCTMLNLLLYHYIDNGLLLDAPSLSFPIAEAVCEVLEHELRVNCSQSNAAYATKIYDLMWFFLDVVLRSLYLRRCTAETQQLAAPLNKPAAAAAVAPAAATSKGSKQSKGPASPAAVPPAAAAIADTNGGLPHPSFWPVCCQLVKQIVIRLVKANTGVSMTTKVTLFVRNLMTATGGCDGAMQCTTQLLSALEEYSTPALTQVATRLLFDADDLTKWSLPSPRRLTPRYYLRAIMSVLVPQLVSVKRDIRVPAANTLSLYLGAATTTHRLTDVQVTALAGALFPIVIAVAADYAKLKAQIEKDAAAAVPGATGINDKRTLLVAVAWILCTAPRYAVRAWAAAANPAVLGGFLSMLSDILSVTRSNYAVAPPSNGQPPRMGYDITDGTMWVALNATLAITIAEIAGHILLDRKDALQTVRFEKSLPCVYPFFALLDSAVQLTVPTVALQVAASVYHGVVRELTPEILSGKSRMAPGMVLLAVRLCTSVSPSVRKIAADSFLEFAMRTFALHGSLEKFQSLLVSALVSVAETQGRNMQQSHTWLAKALEAVHREALRGDDSPVVATVTKLGPSDKQRFGAAIMEAPSVAAPPGSPGADLSTSGAFPAPSKLPFIRVHGRSSVAPLPQTINTVKGALEAQKERIAKADPFEGQLGTLVATSTALFSSVVRLHSDPALRFSHTKGLAYASIVHSFLKQFALKEVLKWLYRLHEAHRNNGDNVEAAVVNVMITGLAFRVTEFFYIAHGPDTQGVKLPIALYDYLCWHDYVRVFPDLEFVFPDEMVAAIVSTLSCVPDDKAFAIEGQTTLLKEAAEWFGRGYHFENSIAAAILVQTIVWSKDDFKSTAVVAEAVSKWANAVAANTNPKRLNCKFFYVNAVGPTSLLKEPFCYVFKLAAATDIAQFAKTAREMVGAVVGSEDAVIVDTSGAAAPTFGKGAARTRVALSVYEVQPFFEDSDPRASSPKLQDRFLRHKKFQYAMRVNDPGESPRPPPMTRAQAQALSQAARTLDVSKQRLRIIAHTTDRSFPSYTTAISVVQSSETSLDPLNTCVETIHQQFDLLTAINPQSPPNEIVHAVFQSMTPLDVHPAGYYFKEAIKVYGHLPQVHAAIDELLVLAKQLVEKCATVSPEFAERYAAVLKANIDMECAIAEAQSRLQAHLKSVAQDLASNGGDDAASQPAEDARTEEDEEELDDENPPPPPPPVAAVTSSSSRRFTRH